MSDEGVGRTAPTTTGLLNSLDYLGEFILIYFQILESPHRKDHYYT